MINEEAIKQEICDIGKRIYNRGMVASNDGNISVKISEHEFLCTPTGVSKGFMTPEYICKVDENGQVLQANGNFRPSSEIKMHMRVYKERPDVQSVVHAHPMYATAFAIAGIPLTQPIMPEAVIALGSVPIAEYGTPSTNEISGRRFQISALFRCRIAGQSRRAFVWRISAQCLPQDGVFGILCAVAVFVSPVGRTKGTVKVAGGKTV